MTSVIREILEKRRDVQRRNQIPDAIEIGELKARRLADELTEHGDVFTLPKGGRGR